MHALCHCFLTVSSFLSWLLLSFVLRPLQDALDRHLGIRVEMKMKRRHGDEDRRTGGASDGDDDHPGKKTPPNRIHYEHEELFKEYKEEYMSPAEPHGERPFSEGKEGREREACRGDT